MADDLARGRDTGPTCRFLYGVRFAVPTLVVGTYLLDYAARENAVSFSGKVQGADSPK